MAVLPPHHEHQPMTRPFHSIAAGLAIVVLGGCAAAPSAAPVTLQLRELNDSGVSGTVTMTTIDEGHTLVEIDVDAAGHPNMPAHIHPGTCAELVPQPKYALQAVVAGHSSTAVPASLEELLSGGQALNIHSSNEHMDLYSACGELG
jgi:hypothetical protein